jgi:hypothetical protein
MIPCHKYRCLSGEDSLYKYCRDCSYCGGKKVPRFIYSKGPPTIMNKEFYDEIWHDVDDFRPGVVRASGGFFIYPSPYSSVRGK